MAQTEYWMKTDLNQNVSVRSIKGNFFSQDNNGNIIGVVVVKGGAPETLTGNVYGYIIRPDGATVVVEGSASENRASIQIPSQALAYTGRIDIVIQLASSSVRTVLGACTGTVVQSRTDQTVDPGEIIPDISELLAIIDECEAAKSAANTAASNANTKAGLADTAATNANTKAGLADSAATAANGAASAANTAAGKINDMTVAAETLAEGASATATISEVSGHKHILFGIPKGDTGEIDIDDTAGTGDTDKAWSADKLVDEFAAKADKATIKSPEFVAGNASEVLSDRGDTDITPYVFRKTGGAKKAYNREILKKIVGGTVAWNQHIKNSFDSLTQNGVTFTVDNTNHTITVSTDSNGATANTIFVITNTMLGWPQGHKVYIGGLPAGQSENTYNFIYYHSGGGGGGVFTGEEQIINIVSAYGWSYGAIRVAPGAVITTPVVYKPQICNLTQMFGSTIADAIYDMEQATAGVGVAWFRNLFPNDYYAYDAGSLQSVQAKEHRTVGKNQIPMTVAGIKSANTSGTWSGYTYTLNGVAFTIQTDSNGNITGIEATGAASADTVFRLATDCALLDGKYKNWNTGNNNCHVQVLDKNNRGIVNQNNNYTVTLSSSIQPLNAIQIKVASGYNPNGLVLYPMLRLSTVTDATFEPYQLNTYPIDSSITLRGIPKWDSTNGMYYDGDEYTPDGNVKRKYGIVDLGSLTWSYQTYNDKSWMQASITNPKRPAAANTKANIICAVYKTQNGNVVASNGEDKTIAIPNDSDRVMVYDSSYSDAAIFKTAISGVYLVYELATPTTETVDPYQELQICNRYGTEEFVDAGVSATTPTRDVAIPVGTETFYPVNVFDYIEELTQPDHDMVADTNIASGKYFMVGNTLYLATQAIAQGAAIVPGTNCTAYSLADALNLINQ